MYIFIVEPAIFKESLSKGKKKEILSVLKHNLEAQKKICSVCSVDEYEYDILQCNKVNDKLSELNKDSSDVEKKSGMYL